MKDIRVQTVSLQPEANYNASQAMPTSEIGYFPDDYIQYNTPQNNNEQYTNRDDRYPLNLIETLRESNTATAVYTTRARFIYGSGCADEEMGNLVINPLTGDTLNDLVKDLSKDAAKQKQNYLFIKLDGNRKGIYSIQRISPQNARLKKPNSSNQVTKVYYSPYAFGTRDTRSEGMGKIKGYPFYSETKTSPNQVYYYNFDREYNEYYPYPFSKTQFELFQTDAQITRFHFNNLKNNFFGGAMISIVGDPNKQVRTGTDSEDNPIMSSWGDVMAKELGRTKAGAENAGNMTIIWSNPDSPQNSQAPTIQPITSNNQADIFSKTQEDVTDNIARVAEVPTILANIQVAGKLGNTEELLNSVDLLIASTDSERRAIERILRPLLMRMPEYSKKWKGEDFIIQPPSMIRNIPDRVWQEMSKEARLDFIRKNFSIEIEDDVKKEEVNPNPQIEKEEEKQKILEEETRAIINKYK